ncbi:MAG TPA: SPASM domain-containing protein [Chitinophagales bacterium]|nr:SPASM domain-containing protein [Chitinophagales bacterium]
MTFRCTDSLAFLQKTSPRKAINAAKVIISYFRSRITGIPRLCGLPITVSVEPTTSCNLRCPECPSGLRAFTRDRGMMELSLFKKTVDELEYSLIFLYLYFQGEPYLHPRFADMVMYASRKNIFTVSSTNAHFLDDDNARKTVESGLSRLIISIDGITQDSYAKYRLGGNLERVLEGTKNLLKWKKKLQSNTPHVIFQMVVFRHNENEILGLHKIADDCGVDEVKLKTAQIYDFEKNHSLIPSNEKYSRYSANLLSPALNGFYQIKNPLLNHCWKMWHSCVVTWDGKVVPCCFDKDASYVMGDLKKQSFRDIWTGEAYNAFRYRLLTSRKEIDICRNCSEGTKVWI